MVRNEHILEEVDHQELKKVIKGLKSDHHQHTPLSLVDIGTWKKHYQQEPAEHRAQYISSSPTVCHAVCINITIKNEMVTAVLKTTKIDVIHLILCLSKKGDEVKASSNFRVL